MKIDQLRKALTDLPVADGKQLMDEIFADEAGRQILAPLVDRHVNRAVQTAMKKAEDRQVLAKRLDQIEASYTAKVARLELEYQAKVGCLERGIDYRLLGRFDDAQELADRLELVGEAFAKSKIDGVNAAMISVAHRPGSGDAETILRPAALEKMAPEDILEAHKAGRIRAH